MPSVSPANRGTPQRSHATASSASIGVLQGQLLAFVVLAAFFDPPEDVSRQPFGIADRHAFPVRFGTVDAERRVVCRSTQLVESVVDQLCREGVLFVPFSFGGR